MDYRTIGYVAGTHGIKGEIKVKLYTDFVDERFAIGNTVYLEHNGKMNPYTVAQARMHKGFLLVKFAEIGNLNEVVEWRSLRLCVSSEQLGKLDKDEIYLHDLMNMEVETLNHELLGRVVELLDSGAHYILRVQGEREILIPYVKAFIKEVDMDTKRLMVELLEGM
ncbi:MAG: ribosome maturation factor RimM [Erysipelotrichaceae bacterium]|nr:ribosome maturation factor RimM [Erysipelotrichaceae bacterium]